MHTWSTLRDPRTGHDRSRSTEDDEPRHTACELSSASHWDGGHSKLGSRHVRVGGVARYALCVACESLSSRATVAVLQNWQRTEASLAPPYWRGAALGDQRQRHKRDNTNGNSVSGTVRQVEREFALALSQVNPRLRPQTPISRCRCGNPHFRVEVHSLETGCSKFLWIPWHVWVRVICSRCQLEWGCAWSVPLGNVGTDVCSSFFIILRPFHFTCDPPQCLGWLVLVVVCLTGCGEEGSPLPKSVGYFFLSRGFFGGRGIARRPLPHMYEVYFNDVAVYFGGGRIAPQAWRDLSTHCRFVPRRERGRPSPSQFPRLPRTRKDRPSSSQRRWVLRRRRDRPSSSQCRYVPRRRRDRPPPHSVGEKSMPMTEEETRRDGRATEAVHQDDRWNQQATRPWLYRLHQLAVCFGRRSIVRGQKR